MLQYIYPPLTPVREGRTHLCVWGAASQKIQVMRNHIAGVLGTASSACLVGVLSWPCTQTRCGITTAQKVKR